MFIPPFAAGVITTIFAELALIFLYALFFAKTRR